jgi:hypothetical protein
MMDAGERIAVLQQAYRLFNERQVDAALAMMTDDIEWPNVAEGTVLHGKDAIRRYWDRQFAVADPRVSPTDFVAVGEDVVAVVDQRIFDLHGQRLVAPSVVFHRYTFAGDLVRRMVVFADHAEALAKS